MLLHVGMIGRALKGDVQRHLDAEIARALHEAAEILQGAQLRMHRLMPALLGADGPGAARIFRARQQGVVAALAVGAADGMNGRKVQHVEAHGGDFGQPRLAVLEGAVPTLLAHAGARKQLVPGAEPGAFPDPPRPRFPLVPRGQAAGGILRHGLASSAQRQACVLRHDHPARSACIQVLRRSASASARARGLLQQSAPASSATRCPPACTRLASSVRQEPKRSIQAIKVY